MITHTFTFLIFISLSFSVLSQNRFEFSSELFRISLDNNLLKVENVDGTGIFSKELVNPVVYPYDLDNDGIVELLVEDNIPLQDTVEFLLYVYNLLDSFYLAAEINSGIIKPYQIPAGEIDGLIIVTGNSDFSFLNKENTIKSLPINCWKFEDGDIFSVNEVLYDIFISENENLLMRSEFLEINNCTKSMKLKSLLASGYVNYLNAGEITSAENLLKTFYLCDDLESFKNDLDKIFNREN